MKLRLQTIAAVGILSVIGLVPGCASSLKPSPEVLAQADYGTAVTQTSAQQQADTYLAGTLKDPESRRVTWGQIEQGYERSGGSRDEWMFGYKMLASVNAKNSYGGYTGGKPYVFFFRDGTLTAVFTTVTKVGRSSVYDVYQRVY